MAQWCMSHGIGRIGECAGEGLYPGLCQGLCRGLCQGLCRTKDECERLVIPEFGHYSPWDLQYIDGSSNIYMTRGGACFSTHMGN